MTVAAGNIAFVDVAGINIGIAVNVDVVIAATTIVAIPVTTIPGGTNRRTPDQAGSEGRAGRVGVVINRVRRWVIAIARVAARNHDRRGVVLRYVDDFRVGLHHLDHLFFNNDRLLVVGFEIADGLYLSAEALNCLDNPVLISHHGFAEIGCPVDFGTHLLDDIGVVEQRFDRILPGIIKLQALVGLAFVEEAIGLNDFERVSRCRKNEGDQIVRVQRDGRNQLIELRCC